MKGSRLLALVVGCCLVFALGASQHALGQMGSSDDLAPGGKLQKFYHSLPTMISQKLSPSAMLQIEDRLASLTLEERLGQSIMPIIYPKYTRQEVKRLRTLVDKGKIGGILFQKGDVWEQYCLTRDLQATSPIPLMISLDGEWGLAMRLSPTIRYPKMRSLSGLQELDWLEKYGADVAQQCRAMGIHVNFSPVVDVNNNPQNPVIGVRSFSEDPSRVVACAVRYARGLEKHGVLSVAKHFPGHGNTAQDSHKELPTVSSSRATLDSIELRPFREYFAAGLGGVMVAHLSVPSLEAQPQLPTSMSRRVVTDLLQHQLGFRGLIFTDALEMRGAVQQGEQPISVQAYLAGNDILLGGKPGEVTLQELVDAYRQGVITEAVVMEKCRKILAYKYVLCGGLEPNTSGTGFETRKELVEALHRPEYLATASHLWREGVEVLHSKDLPLPWLVQALGRVSVVHIHPNNEPITPLENRLRQSGVRIVASRHIYPQTSLRDIRRILEQSQGESDRILVAVYDARSSYAAHAVARFMPSRKSIFVGFMSPYAMSPWLSVVQRAGTALLAYENLPQAYQAMLDRCLGVTTPIVRPAETATPSLADDDPTAHLTPIL